MSEISRELSEIYPFIKYKDQNSKCLHLNAFEAYYASPCAFALNSVCAHVRSLFFLIIYSCGCFFIYINHENNQNITAQGVTSIETFMKSAAFGPFCTSKLLREQKNTKKQSKTKSLQSTMNKLKYKTEILSCYKFVGKTM